MDIEQLIERCIANERTAQKQLFMHYKDALYSLAYRITGDYEIAKDLLQESFIDAFKSLGRLEDRRYFYSWIKKIIVRKSYRHLKGKVRTEELNESEQLPVLHQSNLDIEYIEIAIQSLPLKSRTVFIMIEVEGFSHKEIAETLEISVGTSKSQLHYAKSKLKTILKAYLVE